MKKIITAAAAVLALAVLLASCGTSGGRPAASSDVKTDGGTVTSGAPENTAPDTSGADTAKATDEITSAEPEKPEPYLRLYVDTAEFIDDETTNSDGGGSGNPIQYVDGYGCGYASLGDAVAFRNVDFGEKGASSIIIDFSNGSKDYSVTTVDVRIDSLTDGDPACSLEIKYTGGWDIGHAKPFEADCAVPAGTHTVYVVYTNGNSGSFDTVSFREAE